MAQKRAENPQNSVSQGGWVADGECLAGGVCVQLKYGEEHTIHASENVPLSYCTFLLYGWRKY